MPVSRSKQEQPEPKSSIPKGFNAEFIRLLMGEGSSEGESERESECENENGSESERESESEKEGERESESGSEGDSEGETSKEGEGSEYESETETEREYVPHRNHKRVEEGHGLGNIKEEHHPCKLVPGGATRLEALPFHEAIIKASLMINYMRDYDSKHTVVQNRALREAVVLDVNRQDRQDNHRRHRHEEHDHRDHRQERDKKQKRREHHKQDKLQQRLQKQRQFRGQKCIFQPR